ncbi:hypothetical protein VD0004_g5177 [Verticillium dahliae]|uniref:Uncharacterized protein n=1 Tax=Verticillium dahliae TaxID=27337 RepID=A0AA44WN33_VERDA|nr:hypothetical protein BJF96_g2738 [Verticillium dahliae]PNH42025.1 hypothetical protein VD0004_g5177 [Verticillium dahliae]PNH74681.1 hypothetical protein VD0001_g2887 [Verticillium dahliae]
MGLHPSICEMLLASLAKESPLPTGGPDAVRFLACAVTDPARPR